MTFSIVTPSFRQLDWLRLCVESVRDQAAEVPAIPGGNSKSKIQNPESGRQSVTIEHIIQDAGSPGIEDFARGIGADFHRDGALVFSAANPESKIPSSNSPYRVTIHCEKDAGMYDAVNRGFAKASGDILAYLNCDEQYLPGALDAVAGRFSDDPSVEMLFADAVVAREDGEFLCFRKAQVPFRDQLWFRMPVLSCATFVRRRVVHDRGVRLDDTKKVIGDVIWILRAQRAGVRMGILRQFTSLFTETDANLGVGGTADREFIEFRAGMPPHVRRFLKLYELRHKVRSLLAGTRHHPPFSYEIRTLANPSARKHFDVPRPTAVWKGRTDIDRAALQSEKR